MSSRKPFPGIGRFAVDPLHLLHTVYAYAVHREAKRTSALAAPSSHLHGPRVSAPRIQAPPPGASRNAAGCTCTPFHRGVAQGWGPDGIGGGRGAGVGRQHRSAFARPRASGGRRRTCPQRRLVRRSGSRSTHPNPTSGTSTISCAPGVCARR